MPDKIEPIAVKLPRFLIGTSGWSYDHWKGCFYPEQWAKSRWFEYYSQQFNVVEINTTFYRRFQDSTYRKWYDKAPGGFTYVLKAPRLITHRKYLVDAEQEIRAFARSVSLLQDKFGLILLQLPPRIHYDPERLRKAILAFGDPTKIAVEFRNDQWLTQEIRELLTESGAVFCNADSPETPLMNWVTGAAAYIRLHGRTRWYSYDYSDKELQEIASVARQIAAAGATEIYIFFNNDYNGHAPKNALALAQILTTKSPS